MDMILTGLLVLIVVAALYGVVIYNQLGQQVVTLVDQAMQAGDYEVAWQGLDAQGRPVSSGLYFYRMLAGSEQLVGKMTYLK